MPVLECSRSSFKEHEREMLPSNLRGGNSGETNGTDDVQDEREPRSKSLSNCLEDTRAYI